jgi:HD-GYP domain-containing protein (c-di-GMP phosphodiesterase class II)
MTASKQTEFKPITRAFFKKEWEERFDIFYQTTVDGERKFVKFAEFDPQDYSHLDAILDEKQNEMFYIREIDLYKYYRFNILKHLLLGLVQDKPPAREVFQRVYPVATRILQDYLEIPTSDEFLVLLDELPMALSKSLDSENLRFQELFAITLKEDTIHAHCVNVGMYCLCLARELGMNRKDREEICRGGMLADIGKKFIPMEVMFKKEALTDEDRQTIRLHTAFGKKKLNEQRRYSKTVLRMAGEHHENFDGTGYPLKLAGNEINTAARVCKIMDVFNALTSHRPYREVMTPIQALTLMKEKMGEQFDTQLLTALIQYAGRQ